MNKTKRFAFANVGVCARPQIVVGLLLLMITVLQPSGVAAQNQTSVRMYFFTNHGCAPCRQVEPGIEALTKEGYPVTTIILDEQPDWAQQFSVDRTPTVILVADNKIVGRHAGLINAETLKQWFVAVGVPAGYQSANSTAVAEGPLQSALVNGGSTPPRGRSTLHQGTRQPANAAEQRALNATVRLKVEDPEGISYATGTVVHCHDGEWLVMTCGHVFRESKGQGKITADFGFADGKENSAPGQLISYDADARDIALIAVQAGQTIEPVLVAKKTDVIDRGDAIFSIGCDQGDLPTIRNSQIKNRAAYDGALKYDIFGRPVNGRSGGGLFNTAGELIGVCNAAAVEEDEGIFTALETVHWQIAQANLEDLFEAAANPAGSVVEPTDIANVISIESDSDNILHSRSNENRGMIDIRPAPKQGFSNNSVNSLAAADRSKPIPTPVGWEVSSAAEPTTGNYDREVIIIVRSKSDPQRTEAITISHPSGQLLEYLGTMQNSESQPRQLDVAELRKNMPTTDIPANNLIR